MAATVGNRNLDPPQGRPLQDLLQDRIFWIAILAGPACWLGLLFLGPWALDFPFSFGSWRRIFVLAFFYPLLEEGLFRGLVQPLLMQYPVGRTHFFGLSGANLATTVFFVSLHFFNQPIGWALLLVFPSLVFGHFRDKYQSVVPPMLLHCFYNFGFFALFPPA